MEPNFDRVSSHWLVLCDRSITLGVAAGPSILNTEPWPSVLRHHQSDYRAGSADRVVLPVPDSREQRVSPSSPNVGAQVHGQTHSFGRAAGKFCHENMAFVHLRRHTAYQPTSTCARQSCMITQLRLLVPSRSGSKQKCGAFVWRWCQRILGAGVDTAGD